MNLEIWCSFVFCFKMLEQNVWDFSLNGNIFVGRISLKLPNGREGGMTDISINVMEANIIVLHCFAVDASNAKVLFSPWVKSRTHLCYIF